MQKKLYRFAGFSCIFMIVAVMAACSSPVKRPSGSVQEAELSMDKQPMSEPELILPGKHKRNREHTAVDTLLTSANNALAAGQYQLAAAQIERAIRVAPDDPRAYFSLAQVHYRQDRKELARSFLDKAESLATGDKVLMMAISQFRKQYF